VQVGLAGEQAVDDLLGGGLRNQPLNQGHRALVQHPGGTAVSIAFDASVGRVGGVGGDPGRRQRHRVDPGAVVVAVGQEYRTIGHQVVERRRCRHATGKGRHRPAATQDPLLIRVVGGIGGDHGLVLAHVVGVGQVAAQQLHAATDGVNVGVLETGDQQPTGEVDHLGSRTDQRSDIDRSDRNDAPAQDRHGVGTRTHRVCGEHRPAGEHQICIAHLRPLTQWFAGDARTLGLQQGLTPASAGPRRRKGSGAQTREAP